MAKSFYPDPVTIPVGEMEPLDIAVQAGQDAVAYGWNNEAYFGDWRPDAYLLDPDRYDVSIKIRTQNGVAFQHHALLSVSSVAAETRLEVIKPQSS